MSNPLNEKPNFFESRALPYVYVFWKQAQPSMSEVEALHQVDPYLKRMSIAQVAALLNEADWWRIGPLTSDAEMDAIEAQLTAFGLTVKKEWQ